jgi:competence protein ComEC
VTWLDVAAAYAVLGIAMGTAVAWARRRRGAATPRRGVQLALIATAATVAFAALGGGSPPEAADPAPGLKIVVLDVGQGDAILLDPLDGDPILVDGGPPGEDLGEHLESEGVSSLAAAVVTHDQSDHVGGIDELLYDGLPIHRLIYSRPAPDFLRAARIAHVPAQYVAEGSELRSGSLRLEVAWPPRAALEAPAADPNQAAVVLVARWHSFSMLLTADAEAEAVPLDPGPIDVLKVAHHGSEDAGLDALLDRTMPRLAVVSVGADNPYGHPTPQTLATLAEHRVPTLRTDVSGDVTLEVDRGGWRVEGE